MKSKLLFITCHKLSGNNGGSNASKGFIYSFAKLFEDCSLIYPEIETPNLYIPKEYKLFPCRDPRTKFRKGFDMYLGVVNALRNFVIHHLKSHSYDIIVVDHSVTGTGLAGVLKQSGAKIITIHHNVERDYLRDNGKERPIIFRYPYNYFAKKSEKNCLKLSSVNLTLTEKDASIFRSWYPNINIHAYCLGICEYRGILAKTFPLVKKNSNKFVITGSLCFIQSLKPILEFLEIYYPILKEECPDCELVIAGRNPSNELIDFCKNNSNISLIPNPENIESLTQESTYYICPINAGSGIKLRVLDGLKQGLPILCHEISSNGYEMLIEKGCMFSYSDTNSFRQALRHLLDANLSKGYIYSIYANSFSVDALTIKLNKILKSEKIL